MTVSADASVNPQPSFEQAMKELEGIVRRLESGNADLESAIADYMKGMSLKEYCEKKLSDARLKVESIIRSADGTPTGTQPFEQVSLI